MKVFIHTIDKTLYEGVAPMVSLPATGGEISVLDKHIPLVTSLASGMVKVHENETSSNDFPVTKGFAQVNSDHVIVLLN